MESKAGYATISNEEFLKYIENEKLLNGLDKTKEFAIVGRSYYTNNPYLYSVVYNPSEITKNLIDDNKRMVDIIDKSIIFDGHLIHAEIALNILEKISNKWWFRLFYKG